MNDQVAAAAQRLAAAGSDSARLEARLLWEHAQKTGADFEALVARREHREPVAYITGHREFYGLDFAVTPDALIPRPDTEVLVEHAIRLASAWSLASLIADIGTGCGAIAVCLAKRLPAARIFATDISAAALAVARGNCERHRVTDRITLLLGDLLEPLPGPVDIIAANLPYVRTADLPLVNTSGFEPRLALDGGADGLDQILRLCAEAPRYLNPHGALLLEIGLGQREAVAALLARHLHSASIAFAADLAGIDRVAIATLA